MMDYWDSLHPAPARATWPRPVCTAQRGVPGLPERRGTVRICAKSQAKILFENGQLYCAVRDISKTGACVLVGRGNVVPREFDFLLVRFRVKIRARLVWRRGDYAGIAFGPAPPSPPASGSR